MRNFMDEFYETIESIRKEIEGKIVARSGFKPIGRVSRVDEQGAWLANGGRITILGLPFYHPVDESRMRELNYHCKS
jgi:hypothetical protein